MKTLELSEASQSLAEYARDLGEDTIVLTANDRPLAALVSLEGVDAETLALSTSSDFLALVKAARAEIRAGEVLSLEEMRREVL